MHVAVGIDVDHQAHSGDDEKHNDAQAIYKKTDLYIQAADRKPIDWRNVQGCVVAETRENNDGQQKREPDGGDRDLGRYSLIFARKKGNDPGCDQREKQNQTFDAWYHLFTTSSK